MLRRKLEMYIIDSRRSSWKERLLWCMKTILMDGGGWWRLIRGEGGLL
jgi:hypothetical protein